ncbi:hypothetical protein [Legionella worsleiensis]|uniref:Uncharacterized protein n=1 Tax=Legionella worsleiensis TaxID=45076 RepID=A0A0W1A604_9GAMM|nr:hypothetical protein [Legionella worsleiensis]KTD76762.1 hypothetical protein Lwor_1987 [Legionella worsleiensis]STY30578.1 Uncharacterised protein [Legionella worsleiensis]
MKVRLDKSDYESISVKVVKQLRNILPDNEFAQQISILGPEFMAEPLRISTPSTRLDFELDPKHKEWINELKNEISSCSGTSKEKRIRMEQLESITLFGQILFAQSAALHFLDKTRECNRNRKLGDDTDLIHTRLDHLNVLIDKEGIQHGSSKLDTLKRRKAFDDELAAIKKEVKVSSLPEAKKNELLYNLAKTKDFYYQANDFNFQYADKPSRSYSDFVNKCERISSKISLVASLIAIGATALAFIPPLAPIMAPIALAASAISLALGAPFALKNVGTMLYNLIRFGAAPTPVELVTTALVGTSTLLVGVGGVVGHAVRTGVLQKTAQLITNSFNGLNTVTVATASAAGQFMVSRSMDKVALYKSQLEQIKSQKSQPDKVLEETELIQPSSEKTTSWTKATAKNMDKTKSSVDSDLDMKTEQAQEAAKARTRLGKVKLAEHRTSKKSSAEDDAPTLPFSSPSTSG